MNNRPSGSQAASAMDILYGSDVKTDSDRWLLKVCKITAISTFGAPLLEPYVNTFPLWLQRTAVVATVVSLILFLGSWCIIGIRVSGRSAGKKTFLLQAIHVLSRVGLFMFLPCIIVTALLVVWATLTHQPTFR